MRFIPRKFPQKLKVDQTLFNNDPFKPFLLITCYYELFLN